MFSFYDRVKKAIPKVILLSFLLIFSKSEGGNYFSNCCPSFCDWDISIGVDYLYWKPCTNDLKYVSYLSGEEDSGFTSLYEVRGICPDWGSGYRFGFEAFQTCGSPVGIVGSFTHLDVNKDDRLTDDTLLPIFTHPLYNQLLQGESIESLDFKEATASWESEYNQWDIGISYRLKLDGGHLFSPFIGIGGLHFDEQFNVFYLVADDIELDGVSTYTVADLELTGIGLKIGLDYRYAICNGFHLYTFANGTVLVSESESSVKFGTAEEDGMIAVEFLNLKFAEKECCTFIPGYHLGIGLNYTGCLCGCRFFLNAGYEFTGWHHVPDPRLFVEGFDGIGENANVTNVGVSRSYQSRVISYHGVSLGGGFTF